jgi:precorrin-2 methylase
MLELKISPAFTVEDIHRVREYHFELTKNMTTEERRAFYKKGADDVEKRLSEIRKRKALMKT